MIKETKERLHRLCREGMVAKGLEGDPAYEARLAKELRELDAQGDWEYFVKLHDRFRAEKLIFPRNEYNNLIDYVLGLAPPADISRPSEFVQGECPDIDTDFLKPARDYLKRDWAPRTFGQSRVCEIGTNGTTGIKSGILDMAKMHGLPRDEIQPITAKIKDKYNDDEGNTKDLEWEDALEFYPEFKEYCEKNEDVAKAAKMLLDRHKSAGVHAGGLVISSVDIDGFVPLEVRMVTKENPAGVICSAWTEGQHRQDLGPVGLIKFDLLVVSNLMQIAIACKMIKERHGLDSLYALPGREDWSDISYLDDPDAIAMANRGDLKCIFQFDSEGIRRLAKNGGVTKFGDVAAYSAIYRPACLAIHMDAHYCKRKRGEEPYNIHPAISPYLEGTYGIMVFQEQVGDVLRVVGEIPDAHTEKIRKAISKKKVEVFGDYREQFIENGQKVLGVNAEHVIELWSQLEKFSGYGFCKAHAYAYAMISMKLLTLKAHYPLEFYTAVLMCEDRKDKQKEYKLDAESHGVRVCPVHINKSKENFGIHGKKVFFGFGNIKGLGAAAERVVSHQPYSGFVDFLDRFGTDAKVIKPLTALGVFEGGHDRLTLRKFAEFYKKAQTSRRNRRKKFAESMDGFIEELRGLLLEEVSETDPDFERMCQFTEDADLLWQDRFVGVVRRVPFKYKGEQRYREETFVKRLRAIVRKRQISMEKFAAKEEKDDAERPDPETSDLRSIAIDEAEEAMLRDVLTVRGVESYPSAEREYYGFQWTHRLETCDNYVGNTFDKFLKSAEEDGLLVGMVEVEVVDVEERLSKNNVQFWTIKLEDANGTVMKMNIFKDDYRRFEEELKVGTLTKIRVRPPSGGFETLTFDSVPKNKRHTLPPKDEDYRLIVMRPNDKPPEPEPEQRRAEVFRVYPEVGPIPKPAAADPEVYQRYLASLGEDDTERYEAEE